MSQAAGLPVAIVSSKRRVGKAPLARQVMYYHLFRAQRFNKSELGRMFGVDHTTIIYALRRVADLLQTGDELTSDLYSKISGMDMRKASKAHKVVYHTNGVFKVYDRWKNEMTELTGLLSNRQNFEEVCDSATRFFITNGDEIEIQMMRGDFIKLFTVVS